MFEELGYNEARLQSAIRHLRNVYAGSDDVDDIYRTFRMEALHRMVDAVHDGVRFSNRLVDESGIQDCLDAHYDQIIQGLMPKHFPPEELRVLREGGSADPEADLAGILAMLKAKERRQQRLSEQSLISNQLESTAARLAADETEFRKVSNDETKETRPKRPRRWFKGLGQIGQGAALTIADHYCPVKSRIESAG